MEIKARMAALGNIEEEFIEDHPKKAKRHRGVVMTLVHDEGFGFIADEYDGQERFFHATWIDDPILNFGDIIRGQRLSFLPVSSDKGYKAINVRRLKKERLLGGK